LIGNSCSSKIDHVSQNAGNLDSKFIWKRNLHPKGPLSALMNGSLPLTSPEGIRFPMQPLHLLLIALLITPGSSTIFDV
jgi:hypothetical protein